MANFISTAIKARNQGAISSVSYIGLSTDTKPPAGKGTEGPSSGETLLEKDTHQVFIWDGDSWESLYTLAVDPSLIAGVSAVTKLTFSWSSVTYDTDAGDTILLVQNNDADRDLKIHTMFLWVDTATIATIHTTDGAALTPTGTSITATNWNRKSDNTASATAKGDETNNTQGGIIIPFYAEANKNNNIDFDDAPILGNGDSIAVDITTAGTAAIACFVGFYQPAT